VATGVGPGDAGRCDRRAEHRCAPLDSPRIGELGVRRVRLGRAVLGLLTLMDFGAIDDHVARGGDAEADGVQELSENPAAV
jgi:hypothetical protein